MKRKDLLKELRKIAKANGETLTMVRQGANHEQWQAGNHRFAVPRHNEINEHLARGLIKDLTKNMESR